MSFKSDAGSSDCAIVWGTCCAIRLPKIQNRSEEHAIKLDWLLAIFHRRETDAVQELISKCIPCQLQLGLLKEQENSYR